MKRFASLVALSITAGIAGAQISFSPVGLPDGDDPQNPKFTDAYGVSDAGVVVGAMNIPGVGVRTFRWTSADGLVRIDGLTPDAQIYARAITPDGVTIVGENTDPRVGFIKSGGGAVESMGIPNPLLYDQTAANDVSNDGLRAAGLISRIDDGTFRMGRWTAGGGWEDLGVLEPSHYESAGNAISGDGSIVAGYSIGNTFTAVKWTQADGMVALNNPFGIESDTAVIAMAADGSTFVGQARDAFLKVQAAVWKSDGSTQILATTSGFDSASAFGVSGDGSIIGGNVFDDQLGLETAAFWVNGEVYDLKVYLEGAGIDLDGWSLTAVTEVSQNGLYLTGRGVNPDGFTEAFLVQIPAPGGALLLGVAMLSAANRRRSLRK